MIPVALRKLKGSLIYVMTVESDQMQLIPNDKIPAILPQVNGVCVNVHSVVSAVLEGFVLQSRDCTATQKLPLLTGQLGRSIKVDPKLLRHPSTEL